MDEPLETTDFIEKLNRDKLTRLINMELFSFYDVTADIRLTRVPGGWVMYLPILCKESISYSANSGSHVFIPLPNYAKI